jgi:hypothetical protein
MEPGCCGILPAPGYHSCSAGRIRISLTATCRCPKHDPAATQATRTGASSGPTDAGNAPHALPGATGLWQTQPGLLASFVINTERHSRWARSNRVADRTPGRCSRCRGDGRRDGSGRLRWARRTPGWRPRRWRSVTDGDSSTGARHAISTDLRAYRLLREVSSHPYR